MHLKAGQESLLTITVAALKGWKLNLLYITKGYIRIVVLCLFYVLFPVVLDYV